MAKSKRLPEFKSYEEMGEFWDTHSLADYWAKTKPAEFVISERVRRRYLMRGKIWNDTKSSIWRPS